MTRSACATADLFRAWVAAVDPAEGETGEVEDLLVGLLARVHAAVAPGLDQRAGAEVGAAVAADRRTRRVGLGATLALLGDGLRATAPFADVMGLLGAVAEGYRDAELAGARADLQTCRRRLDAVLAATSTGMAVVATDGTVLRANPALARVAGVEPGEVVGGRLGRVLGLPGVQVPVVDPVGPVRGAIDPASPRHQLQDAEGDPVWAQLADVELGGAERLVVVEDVTELHLLQRRLAEQALHDVLTGLPNHHYFISHTDGVLGRGGGAAMLMVDVDGLTTINDGLGRAVGDQVLRAAADRLRAVVPRKHAMLARTCGGGFVVLLEDSPSVARTTAVVERILATFHEPLQVQDHLLAVTVGIGVVIAQPGSGLGAREVVRQSDATLHRVKHGGRSQWGYYDAPSDTAQQEHALLATQLSTAWRDGDITLVYERLALADGDGTLAWQALLHWDRGDEGPPVAHEQCMALAEESGLIVPLGRWMLREACGDAVYWRDRTGLSPVAPLRVDLTSRLLLDPDLVSVLRATLSSTGLPLDQLQLGVPFAPLRDDCGDARDNARVLVDMGAVLVLLDGGVEPAYLDWLDEYRVLAVQVSPSLVQRVAQVPGQQSVVHRAVPPTVGLVHSTRCMVIAPHVDTAEQAEWWRAAGADALRGRHVSPLVQSYEVPDLLEPFGR